MKQDRPAAVFRARPAAALCRLLRGLGARVEHIYDY
jgi:hypothetical protein